MAAIRPYLAILLAIILGAAAYISLKPTLAFTKVARPAEAKVIGIHPCQERGPPDGSRSRLDGIAECADIRFKAMSGREVMGAVRGWPGRATKGETIEILYVPEQPERHGRDSVLDLYGIPVLLALAAALVLVRGTVGLGRAYS